MVLVPGPDLLRRRRLEHSGPTFWFFARRVEHPGNGRLTHTSPAGSAIEVRPHVCAPFAAGGRSRCFETRPSSPSTVLADTCLQGDGPKSTISVPIVRKVSSQDCRIRPSRDWQNHPLVRPRRSLAGRAFRHVPGKFDMTRDAAFAGLEQQDQRLFSALIRQLRMSAGPYRNTAASHA